MQIKTMIYCLIPIRMNIIKKRQEVTSVGEDVEKREHRDTAGMNVNWFSHYGKNVEFL